MEQLKDDSVAGTCDGIPKIKKEVLMNDEYGFPEKVPTRCKDVSKEERTFTVSFIEDGKKHQVRGKLTESLLSALRSSKYICDWMDRKKGTVEFHLIEKKESSNVCLNLGMPLKYVSDGSQFELKVYKLTKKKNTNEVWYRHYDDRKVEYIVFYVSGIGSRMESHGAQSRRLIKNLSLLKEYCIFCILAPKGESIKDALCNDGRFLPLLKETNWTLVKDGKITDNDFLVNTLSNEVYEIEVESKKGARCSGDLNKKLNDLDFGGRQLSTLEKPQPQPDFEEGQLSASKKQQPEPDCEQGQFSASKKQQPEPDCEQGQLSACKKQQQLVFEWPLLGLYPKLLKEIQNVEKFLTDNTKNVLEVCKRNFSKEINDTLPFKLVRTLAKYGDSVGYIEWKNGAATCFVLCGRYILTCHHVIKMIVGEGVEAKDWGNRIKQSAWVTFSYEERHPTGQRFSLENWFEIADEDLDFAVLKLEENESKSHPPPGLLQFIFPPPADGPIFIIGHPNGGSKSMDVCLVVSIFERDKAFRNRLQQNQGFEHCHYICGYRPEERCIHMFHLKVFKEGSSNPNVVTYNTCFFQGSSGSPVFNREGQLVALHAAGFSYKMRNKDCSIIEYGYSIHSIISKIESKFKSWHDAVIGPGAREDSSHVDASLREAEEKMDCS